MPSKSASACLFNMLFLSQMSIHAYPKDIFPIFMLLSTVEKDIDISPEAFIIEESYNSLQQNGLYQRMLTQRNYIKSLMDQ